MGWETPRPPSPLNPSIPCARAQLRPRRGEAGRALRELSVQHHRAPAAAAGPAPPLPDSPPRQSHSTLSFSSLIPVIVRREHPRNYDDAELPVKLSFVQGYNRVYAFSLSALAPYTLVSLHCDREVCLQKRWLKSIICHRSIKSSKISSKYFFPRFFFFFFSLRKDKSGARNAYSKRLSHKVYFLRLCHSFYTTNKSVILSLLEGVLSSGP